MQIYQSIANIMTEVSAIKKNNKNAQQGYNFRGIDDLYNAIHPLFARNGVFITSDVVSNNREERKQQPGRTHNGQRRLATLHHSSGKVYLLRNRRQQRVFNR